MNILITGRPGIGKTTLIKELSETIAAEAGGFYTEEVRKGGQRTGFSINTLDGKTGTLSSVNVKSPSYRVGKYGVDLEDFEKTALPAIKGALSGSRTILIDEIGPMELYSERFKEIVKRALDSPNHVIATIKLRSSPFIDSIKKRKDVKIYILNESNRRELAENIRNLLEEKRDAENGESHR